MWVTAHARFDGGPVLRVDTISPPINAPVGASITVEFDGATNQLLQIDLTKNMQEYTITGGALWKGGRAAVIRAPGLQAMDIKARPIIIEKLRTDQPLTEEEVRVTFRYLLGPNIY